MTRTAEKPRGNLPGTVTNFVGRRREIADVRALLGRFRLVTLTGVGGAGKTRLAVEVAAQSRRSFPGGIWMVDLSAVTDEAAVPQTAVNALGILDRAPSPPTDKVAAHLGDSRALLVLDNCEHLGDACAAFADRLIAQTGQVRILATSRRPLEITGEHPFEVPPLSAPAPDGLLSTAALGQYDAVTLLVDRTAALRPGFKITGENGPSVARVCASLDGLPLAIELAASRLRSLSPEQLADRLERRFAVLTTGSPAAEPRQQTLRAVFDWSYSLCSEAERLLWARLSVFAGTFDLAAAEAVCAGAGLPEADVLETLDRLVTQSIVATEAAGDEVRFRLLDTVRQYGGELLAQAGQERELRFRHRDYYLRFAERLAATWCGPGQEAILARWRADHDNLVAALRASMTDPAGPRAALALAVALREHWFVGGFLAEGRKCLDLALALPGGQSGDGRVDALWVAAWVCVLQGDGPAVLARLDECDAVAAELGDRRAAAFARSLRGSAAQFLDQTEAAITLFGEARAVFEEIGETEGELWLLFQFAIALARGGRVERALELCRESLEISEALGERLLRSYTLWLLGWETWRRAGGDVGDSEAVEREALAIQRGFNDPVGTALIIEALAWLAAGRGDPEEAARLLATAGSVWSLFGVPADAFGQAVGEHRAECEARIDLALGDQARAEASRRYRYESVAAAISAVLDEPGRPGTSEAESPLTARELEIAGLVAQGLSNRVIAERLVVSPRTVDGHVERILAKLGFTSRAQVAAWSASASR